VRAGWSLGFSWVLVGFDPFPSREGCVGEGILCTTLSCRRTNDSLGSGITCLLCPRVDSVEGDLLLPLVDLDFCHAAFDAEESSDSLSEGLYAVLLTDEDGTEATIMS